MKITIRKIYQVELAGSVIEVEFSNRDREGGKLVAPGYSHKVIVNGKACDWLAQDWKPSSKVAAFFAEKHG